jgi:DNA polymerase V
MITVDKVWRAATDDSFTAPFVPFLVPGGLPSHADDMEDEPVSLIQLLMGDPDATFFVSITGDSVADFGVRSGDILVVDGKAEPLEGDVVVVSIGSDVTVKRLRFGGSGDGAPGAYLEAGKGHDDIHTGEDEEVIVHGVVTSAVTRLNAQGRLGRGSK